MSVVHNYTNYELIIRPIQSLSDEESRIVIKPGEYKKLNTECGINIYSYDEVKKVHKYDSLLPGKIKNATVAIGDLYYENIIFTSDLAYDADILVGLSYIIPKKIDYCYNSAIVLIYLITFILIGIILYLWILKYFNKK